MADGLMDPRLVSAMFMADWVGSKMAPNNPFAGFGMETARTQQAARMLQGIYGQGAGTSTAQRPTAKTNPFSPAVGQSALAKKGEFNLLKTIFAPGVEARIGADNTVKLTKTIDHTSADHPLSPFLPPG